MISIDVSGTPASKGSMRAMMVGGRPMAIPGGSSKNQRELNAWTRDVKRDVAAAIGDRAGPMFVDLPLEVVLLFKLARPSGQIGKKGVKTSAPAHPAVKPDIDKLARATLDALTGLLFDDDSRIVVLTIIKQFAATNALAESGHTGAVITVRPVPPLQGPLF